MGQSNSRRHTTNTMMLALVFTICIAIVTPFTVNRQDFSGDGSDYTGSGLDYSGSDYYGYGYEYGSGSDFDGSTFLSKSGLMDLTTMVMDMNMDLALTLMV